jgi:hypothetical protein
VGNSLVDMYAKCKGMEDTCRVFNKTLLPCGHSNSKAEHCKSKAGQGQLRFMKCMPVGLCADKLKASVFLCAAVPVVCWQKNMRFVWRY